MAKKHIWYFIADDEGRPVANAEVSILLSGSEIAAAIYTSSSATVPILNAPQLLSGEDGKFEFWIENSTSLQYGYDNTQKFKLRWVGNDIDSAVIDDVTFFDASLPVNESDGGDTNKNKLVSNNLAYGWEQHRNNNTHIVHGIEEIPDWEDLNDDPVKNKLISNKMMLEMYMVNHPKPGGINIIINHDDWLWDEEKEAFKFRVDHYLFSTFLIIDTWYINDNFRFILKDYMILSLNSVELLVVKRADVRCAIVAKRWDADPTLIGDSGSGSASISSSVAPS